jgi:hypothetical protein
MRKLVGIVAVLVLTLFAAVPSEAVYPGTYYCVESWTCPEFRDCFVTDCRNGRCVYDCSW